MQITVHLTTEQLDDLVMDFLAKKGYDVDIAPVEISFNRDFSVDIKCEDGR